MQESDKTNRICGLSYDGNGKVLLYLDSGGRRTREYADFQPFAWITSDAAQTPFESSREHLSGPSWAPLNTIVNFPGDSAANSFMKARDKSLPVEKSACSENLFLARNNLRMFAGMAFEEIRITEIYASISDSPDTLGKIYAVSLGGFGGFKILKSADFSDASERALIESLNAEILARDPDVLAGHGIFRRDLAAISARAKKLKVRLEWGRAGESAVFKKTRLKLAERTFGYSRCDIPGRTVADTFLLVQLYDLSVRDMASYSLGYCVKHFGVRQSELRFAPQEEIKAFSEDFGKMTLQECMSRGSGAKVESLFVEKYLSAGAALPLPSRSKYFEGALSESFASGIFKNVLHYDVASLYPSIMLLLGKCPKNDYLKVFIPLLSSLREYRLKYKKLSKTEKNPALAREFDARQMSFKILINSFYGYLGLDNATFADASLAEEVTGKGREILEKIIGAFSSIKDCKLLEADTDGLYVQSEKYFEAPLELLSMVLPVVPKGIDLEFDGAYDAMLCYKAKNYALLKDGAVILKGSGFKNRSTEPFLRELTAEMAKAKLSGNIDILRDKIEAAKKSIASGQADVESISKSEYINKPVSQYLDEIQNGGARRAPLEAAAMLSPYPEVGDRMSYYIARGDGKRSPDWKNARPSALYDLEKHPYDSDYYLRKIDDWQKRFSDLIDGGQLELF